MAKEMLINSATGQECRIAIVDDRVLEELYVERASSASHVGNVYKGRITNVEPSIQAAFVDFGLPKNGFLHISDVHAQHFPKKRAKPEPVGRKRPHRYRPPIQECLKPGQDIVVQMTKEGIGTKGPTMTTYLSIPGRLLVMMPGMARLGVSRKVEDEEARAKAKQTLQQLDLPPDMGFIVRTAGVDHPKRDLQRDLNYLLRLWKSTEKLIQSAKAPAALYRESDLVIRTIRDVYNSEIHRVVCDDAAVARRVKNFLDVAMPRTKNVVEVYTGTGGLFHESGLEDEIEKIHSRHVELPSGGSLVIDQTEALVAIDVNSGRFRDPSDAETTALKTNLEAAREIGRQLRLRDLGGVVVMDFIDMREEKNRRTVEKTFREAIKPDRAKTRMLHINSFGILELTRQRVGPSLKHSYYRACTHCDGSGLVKSEESQTLAILRILQRACANQDVATIEITVAPPVAHYLANIERGHITRLEAQSRRTIIIAADGGLSGSDVVVTCTNSRGSRIAWEDDGPARDKKKKKTTRLETVGLDKYLKEHPEVTKATAPVQAATEQAPDAEEEAHETKKSRRRGRRGGRKHKPAAETGAGKSPDEAAKGKPEKPERPKARKEQSAKAARSKGKDAKQPPKRRKTAKRAKKAAAGETRGAADTPPAPQEPAEGITTSPRAMLEAMEAERQKQRGGSGPRKSLLQAMGLEDDPKQEE